MSEPTPEPTAKDAPVRKGRVLKTVLAVSLALNLAVVGLVGGAFLGTRGGGEEGRSDRALALRTLGLGPFAVALSREDRSELRARLGERETLLREDRRAIGTALRSVQAALLADPFDRAAAEAALARSRDRLEGLQEQGHMALLDQIETMTAEERAEFAESLNRFMRRRGGGGGPRGGQ